MNPGQRLCEAGDSAMLLQLARIIDPDVNAQAIAIADALRQRALPGVRDIVSTFHSVAIYFDPLRADPAALERAIRDVAGSAPRTVSGRHHEIPVSYGGEDGPDLEAVAAHAHLTPAQVITRHLETEYRVYMLGFQPGFAYMGLLDPAIAMPRRATPRLRVPAGSVGIAGRQTGIYPTASPGGWQIIGRARTQVLESRHSGTALFAPGDRVTFRRAAPGDLLPDSVAASRRESPAVTAFTVLRPGLLTTVQDSGVWGRQGMGVPVGGAMDRVGHALANSAAGNPAGTAALEVTIAGPELRAERQTTIAVAGADLSATLDGRSVPLQTPVECSPGSVLRFGERLTGTRAYVALQGGVATSLDDSAAPLVAGTTIGVGTADIRTARRVSARAAVPVGGARVRVLPGPQRQHLPSHSLDALCSGRFIVSPQSNRVGYRLIGPALPSSSGDMISDATFPGAIQVPPSGEPILLMADRQTTGGYPQVAVVISADLPFAGQLAPGDWIEFVPCSPEDARAALAAQEAMLADAR